MMSPGFIERSASRMMPLTKFETIFCRPKPRPTPIAPLNTANAVRSMPTVLSPISSASDTSTILQQVAGQRLHRRAEPRELLDPAAEQPGQASATHNSTAISSTALMTISSDSRTVPMVRAALSSTLMVGANSPVMSSAATIQAAVATSRASSASRNSSVEIAQHDPQRHQRRGNPDQPKSTPKPSADPLGRRPAAARRRPAP